MEICSCYISKCSSKGLSKFIHIMEKCHQKLLIYCSRKTREKCSRKQSKLVLHLPLQATPPQPADEPLANLKNWIKGREKWIKEAFGARNELSEQETEFRSLAVQSSTPRHGTWCLSVHALGQNADIPRLGVEAYA
ncbi:hypothetical protein PIB30_071526 [Stylosanthes scabra]|uniref:Uncharacterized protein n=1 Tax=Stylosanthes scabra TaxID=79078 RepID=A0ABU6QNL6_9FABA|nr:hypothetical protein [Stylosanthes scabra]